MKLLFDRNLSFRLPTLLSDLYPGSAHVRDHGMAAVDDEAVWTSARDQGFLIVSKDDDFRQRSLSLTRPNRS